MTQSMGRAGPGHVSTNPACGVCNSVLTVAYVHRHVFRTRTEARVKIATWITDFRNSRRP
ncbi:hypothetical protein [Streptomyces sp. NPDC059169]|uniref:hypothetical protein n=1 Tax=unclassified Streptomyces TaxID=2593676 RepID=UPI0036C70F69